jgi:hypothetical protein
MNVGIFGLNVIVSTRIDYEAIIGVDISVKGTIRQYWRALSCK